MMDSTAQPNKYARIERERRFLLTDVPTWFSADIPHWAIYDRYIHGTRFRLRHITATDSGSHTFKLTQKYSQTPGDFARVTITNTYLTEQEYRTFARLPADELWKDRYRYVIEDQPYALDVFRGSLQGLILAEIEVDAEQELAASVAPSFAQAEVTGDAAFTGGSLSRCSFAELCGVIEQKYQRPSR